MSTVDNGNIFASVVSEIDRMETEPDRHLSLQIDARLREAIRSAKASGKPAKLTVEIKVTPGPDRRVTFAGGVKATLPNPPTNAVTLFTDEDGDLFHADPSPRGPQVEIPLPRPSIVKKEN